VLATVIVEVVLPPGDAMATAEDALNVNVDPVTVTVSLLLVAEP
jgi:hypothetical protein